MATAFRILRPHTLLAEISLLVRVLGDGNGNFSANDVPTSNVLGEIVDAADYNRDGRSDVMIDEVATSTHPIPAWGVLLSEPTSATATVTGISPVGTGIHLVDANYPGIPTVLSPSLSNTVGLEAEPVATMLTLLAAPAAGVYQQPFTLAATLNPTTAQNHTASGTVTFSYNGVSLGTSPLVGNAVTLPVTTVLPVGTDTLTATYSGDTNFASSNATLQYVVSASASPLTFTVPNHTFGDPPFTVAATSISTSAITYSVLSGPATISGATVTLTGAGTVILQASQAASGTYTAADQTAIFTVAKEAQTISFAAPASPVNIGVAPIALSATTSSGLTVTLSVLSGPATIAGSTVTIAGAGTVVVAADQAGNQNYLAATEVTHTIVVNKGLPVITMTASPNPVFLLTPVTLTATVSSSAATGSITFFDGTTVLGSPTVSAGVASITVSTLAVGPTLSPPSIAATAITALQTALPGAKPFRTSAWPSPAIRRRRSSMEAPRPTRWRLPPSTARLFPPRSALSSPALPPGPSSSLLRQACHPAAAHRTWASPFRSRRSSARRKILCRESGEPGEYERWLRSRCAV